MGEAVKHVIRPHFDRSVGLAKETRDPAMQCVADIAVNQIPFVSVLPLRSEQSPSGRGTVGIARCVISRMSHRIGGKNIYDPYDLEYDFEFDMVKFKEA
jgi:hypothetical protein